MIPLIGTSLLSKMKRNLISREENHSLIKRKKISENSNKHTKTRYDEFLDSLYQILGVYTIETEMMERIKRIDISDQNINVYINIINIIDKKLLESSIEKKILLSILQFIKDFTERVILRIENVKTKYFKVSLKFYQQIDTLRKSGKISQNNIFQTNQGEEIISLFSIISRSRNMLDISIEEKLKNGNMGIENIINKFNEDEKKIINRDSKYLLNLFRILLEMSNSERDYIFFVERMIGKRKDEREILMKKINDYSRSYRYIICISLFFIIFYSCYISFLCRY